MRQRNGRAIQPPLPFQTLALIDAALFDTNAFARVALKDTVREKS
jgi:hypothetical protein